MRTLNFLSLLLMLLFVSCGGSEFAKIPDSDNYQTDPDDDGQNDKYVAITDLFTQQAVNKKPVDILWVVDNSGSMGDEQASLANNFDRFIRSFVSKDIDFKMAITTTDMTAAYSGLDIGNSRLLLTKAKMDQDQNTFINNFKALIAVGTRGDGYEKGMAGMKRFLERYPDFIRSESIFAIIFVSDEPEQSDQTASYYANHLWNLKSGYKGLIKAYSIVTTSLPSSQVGRKYMELSNLTSGKYHDIMGDFYNILSEIGDQVVELASSYPLSKPRVVDRDLVVSTKALGGTLWEKKTEGTHFDYYPGSNSISFKSGHIPPAGSQIKADYFRYE